MSVEDAEEELLVFGYACKIFHDDEKAIKTDDEHFSVPWMGDPSMKIDRFDGRGVLPDLKPYETLQNELKKEEYLTPEDIMIEEMCDDERYRAMKIADEAEERIKKEELAKRVEKEGAEIKFDYDQVDKPKPAADPVISLHQLATVIGKLSTFFND